MSVETLVGHDWRVVAPWWHWPRLDGAPSPGPADLRHAVRVAPPVLQMYDGADLVNTFLADPQRRLAFDDDTDRVATLTYQDVGRLPGRTVAGGVRKLYLPSHQRFYLVVCALHCDVAGFPHASRDATCDAGFVVRRRTANLPGGPGGEAATLLRRWAVARRKLDAVDRRLRAATSPLARTALERRAAALCAVELRARDAVAELARDAAAVGGLRVLEGWVPVGVDAAGTQAAMTAPVPPGAPDREPLTGIGTWVPVDELPESVAEVRVPLVPLVPDPTRPEHDATGETILFGVVPTTTADVDPTGAGRFDDGAEYEIRCYVTQHLPQCPRDRHCCCPVTWSEPSEPYRLAGHFDLQGTANRPVTVQLPDLRQLHADAIRLSPGKAGGLRFRSPPNSELSFTATDLQASPTNDAMRNGVAQVCSFAIPLITIVAFFVLQLFLPVVVLVFQLWFLLTLRFCLPPDVEVDGGLLADFEALGGGLDVDAGAAASLSARPGFLTAIAALFGGTVSGGKSLSTRILEARAPTAAHRLDDVSFAAVGRGALAQDPADPPARPFARRVTRTEVVVP